MNRVLNARTPAGDALWAVSLTGSEGLSELFDFQLVLHSDSPDIDPQALIGEACALELETQSHGVRWLHGQMMSFAATGRHQGYWQYHARIQPRLAVAARKADYRIFQNRTVPEIVGEILDEHGIRHEWRLKGQYKSWVSCVEYGETDLNFVCRLLEHDGIGFHFEHSAGQHLMVLTDHFSTFEAFPGYARAPYYGPDHARPDEDHFHQWLLTREVDPGRYTHTDYDFLHPSKNLTTVQADPRGHLFDQYEIFAWPGAYTDTGDGTNYAAARLEERQRDQDRVVLEGRVRGAAPGHRLALYNHPRADQNRELLIVRATYTLANNTYEGHAEGQAAEFHVRVEAMPADRPYRPPLKTPKPRTRGPETAVVVGPPGSEIHTDPHGRVRVKFHWERRSTGEGKDSCWIRVSQAWASSNFGTIHIPRVGDEVVVDYEMGDPDRPLITGRLYNAERMPPWPLPANATQSGILTRSSPGGGYDNANAIRFEDKAGAEQLWIHAERNQDIEVEVDETHWVGQDRKKSIQRDETTSIGRDRSESVGNNETIFIGNDRAEDVTGNERIGIHKNRDERVDLSELVDVGINRTMKVGANEKLSVGGNKQDKIGRNWSVKVGKNKTETIAMASMQNVGMGRMDNVGMGYSLNVGLMMNTAVGLSQSTQVGMDQSVKVGRNITYEAGDTLTLKVGASELVMKADGTITLNGKTITADGGEHIQLSSKRVDVN